ncbi:MAG: ABC transporter ATP-binding protein, partial [Polyangiales bacterium]
TCAGPIRAASTFSTASSQVLQEESVGKVLRMWSHYEWRRRGLGVVDPQAMAFIEFQRVAKAFGPKIVYRQLDLSVQRGESLTVIGGSGQGKSVMLKMLIGLLRPDAGEIHFDGACISSLSDKAFAPVRRRIAMLFQGAALFDSLDVGENVAYGLREHLQLSADELGARVRTALAAVSLHGIEHMWPADLSGGMKKRVGLARAIALQPEVLLYDEPTTGLDPINVTRINQLILHLKRSLNITSIVVTHDMASAFAISDRIAMIDEGRVIFTGTPEEIRHTDHPRVRAFIAGDTAMSDDTAPGSS